MSMSPLAPTFQRASCIARIVATLEFIVVVWLVTFSMNTGTFRS